MKTVHDEWYEARTTVGMFPLRNAEYCESVEQVKKCIDKAKREYRKLDPDGEFAPLDIIVCRRTVVYDDEGNFRGSTETRKAVERYPAN